MEHLDTVALLRHCSVLRPDASHVERAWAVFLDRCGPRLACGARRALDRSGMAGRADLLDDLVQEVSTKLWERRQSALASFRGETEAQAMSFLLRLAENAALDWLRVWGAQRRGGTSLRVRLDAVDVKLADRKELDPEYRLLEKERRRWLVRRLQSLCCGRNARRNAWILRRGMLDGWTAREIHRALGDRAELRAIQALLGRARRRLASSGAADREAAPL